jgi:hypothetical protein
MKSEIGQSKMFGMGTAWNNGNKKTNKNVCKEYKSKVSVLFTSYNLHLIVLIKM